MRKQLPAIAVGAVLALLAILAILWLAPVAATDADRADALAAELRCPDCQGLSVADSQTASAREIRRQVNELVASGATDDDVRAHFVDRYGEWILLAPTSPVAWLLPFAALALGVAVLAAWLVRGRSPASPSNVALDDETRRRLHEEAETLDA
jgi:cytochrome c-type biogenesis protein CcmH